MSVPTEAGAYWWRNVTDNWRGQWLALNVMDSHAFVAGWREIEEQAYDKGEEPDFDIIMPAALTVSFGECEYVVCEPADADKWDKPLGGEWGPRIPEPPKEQPEHGFSHESGEECEEWLCEWQLHWIAVGVERIWPPPETQEDTQIQ